SSKELKDNIVKKAYDNQAKLTFVSRLVKHSYEEKLKDSQANNLLVNPDVNNIHVNDNLLVTEEFNTRLDKLAKILQQILETQEILNQYLDDQKNSELLPKQSLENLEYLRNWCKTKFKCEADFKTYQALLRDTLTELYGHEGYLYNYTAQAAL